MPVTLAVVDDYEVVVAGVARMLEPYSHRVDVVEINANLIPATPVDIALYDTFAQGEANHEDLTDLLAAEHLRKVVIYTWNLHPNLLQMADNRNLGGYLSKALPAERLVDALERIAAGEFVFEEPRVNGGRPVGAGDWPGRSFGLTERESEVLALLTQGHTVKSVASIMYLSPNSIKTHVKSIYRKIGVNNRAQAVVWGVEHGFRPDRFRCRSN